MNILLILAHPNKQSLNAHLLEAYQKKISKEDNVRLIKLADIDFNPVFEGYGQKKELEVDLVKAQADILWANKLVFFFPVWWYSVPALLKGFIDRVFLPGFAFRYLKQGSLEKLLLGKEAELVVTSGTPTIYWFLKRGNPVVKMMKDSLSFCGIKVVKVKQFGGVSGEVDIDKILKKLS